MPTRPRHYAVFILNPDGSGMVKQFDTWQEAMTAYADSSNAGKAVYLYPQPTKAVGIGNTPIAPPVASTGVTFTAAQNVGQFEYPSPPVFKRPYSRSALLPPGKGAEHYDAWIEYCKLYPNAKSCTWPGYPKFGTIHHEECVDDPSLSWTDTLKISYGGKRSKIYMNDGLDSYVFKEFGPSGTSTNKFPAPCGYPNGFREYINFRVSVTEEIAIYSLVSANQVQAILNSNVLLETTRDLVQYAGGLGNPVRTEVGILPQGEQGFPDDSARNDETKPLVLYTSGQPVYNFQFNPVVNIAVQFPLRPTNPEDIEKVGEETEDANITITETSNEVKIGTRTADVLKWAASPMREPMGAYNISYDAEAGVGSGTWTVTVSSDNRNLNFEFTSSTPGGESPPEGWAGVVKRIGGSPGIPGEFDGIDTRGTQAGNTWLGEWTYVYYPEGTTLDEDSENYYKADGLGSYTVEAIDDDDDDDDDDCDPVDADLGVDPNDSCNNLYADGMCGTYSNSNGSCDDPDCEDSFLHTDGEEGWSYDGCNWSYDDRWNCESEADHTDGQEGWSYDGCTWSYDDRWNCDDAEEHSGEEGWSYDGCQWSYSEPCETSGVNLGVDPNNSCDDLYADGNCGTYSQPNGSCTGGCDSSGTDLGVDPNNSCNNIYADGSCGTYTSDNGSCDDDDDDDCDSAGVAVSTGNTSPLYITTPCGEAEAGTRTYDVYTDGNCGTTEQTTNEAWASNGTELNSCSDGTDICTYYADGNGSYTTSCSPINPPDECESDSLHEEGEEGWTYDGCHWTQAGDWDEAFPDAGEPYPGEEDFPEEDTAGGNENAPPHEEGTGIAYENAFINGDGNWDINFV